MQTDQDGLPRLPPGCIVATTTMQPHQRSKKSEKESLMKVTKTIPALLVSLVGTAALWAQQPAPPPPAEHKMEMPGKPGMMDGRGDDGRWTNP